MCASPAVDRRKHPRCPHSTSLEFYHEPSERQFPGRCVDVSAGGLMMYVPASTPVQPGHNVRMSSSGLSRPELAGLDTDDINGTVVRVDRSALLRMGHIAVGIRFHLPSL